MNHRYSTYVLFAIIFIVVLVVVIGLRSSDLDELCSINDSILYRYENTWACAYLGNIIEFHNISVINNQSIINNTWIRNNTRINGTIHAHYYNGSGEQLTKVNETDPKWTANSTLVVFTEDTNSWDKDVTNDHDLWKENATLVVYTADTTEWDTNKSDDFNGEWDNLSNIPTGFADGIDNTGNTSEFESTKTRQYFTTSTEALEDFSAHCGNVPCHDMTSGADVVYTINIPRNTLQIVDVSLIVIPDTGETVQWDCLGTSETIGQIKDNRTATQTDEQQIVTDDRIAYLNLTSCVNETTVSNDILTIDFTSDTQTIHAVGLTMTVEVNESVALINPDQVKGDGHIHNQNLNTTNNASFQEITGTFLHGDGSNITGIAGGVETDPKWQSNSTLVAYKTDITEHDQNLNKTNEVEFTTINTSYTEINGIVYEDDEVVYAINATGIIYADFLSGDGSNITGIAGGVETDPKWQSNSSLVAYKTDITDHNQYLNTSDGVTFRNISLENNCADGLILKWSNGVGQCGTDNSGGGSQHDHNQNLNTTDNVNFSSSTATNMRVNTKLILKGDWTSEDGAIFLYEPSLVGNNKNYNGIFLRQHATGGFTTSDSVQGAVIANRIAATESVRVTSGVNCVNQLDGGTMDNEAAGGIFNYVLNGGNLNNLGRGGYFFVDLISGTTTSDIIAGQFAMRDSGATVGGDTILLKMNGISGYVPDYSIYSDTAAPSFFDGNIYLGTETPSGATMNGNDALIEGQLEVQDNLYVEGTIGNSTNRYKWVDCCYIPPPAGPVGDQDDELNTFGNVLWNSSMTKEDTYVNKSLYVTETVGNYTDRFTWAQLNYTPDLTTYINNNTDSDYSVQVNYIGIGTASIPTGAYRLDIAGATTTAGARIVAPAASGAGTAKGVAGYAQNYMGEGQEIIGLDYGGQRFGGWNDIKGISITNFQSYLTGLGTHSHSIGVTASPGAHHMQAYTFYDQALNYDGGNEYAFISKNGNKMIIGDINVADGDDTTQLIYEKEFTTYTNWTNETGWTFKGGEARCNGTESRVTQEIDLKRGYTYRGTVYMTNPASGSASSCVPSIRICGKTIKIAKTGQTEEYYVTCNDDPVNDTFAIYSDCITNITSVALYETDPADVHLQNTGKIIFGEGGYISYDGTDMIYNCTDSATCVHDFKGNVTADDYYDHTTGANSSMFECVNHDVDENGQIIHESLCELAKSTIKVKDKENCQETQHNILTYCYNSSVVYQGQRYTQKYECPEHEKDYENSVLNITFSHTENKTKTVKTCQTKEISVRSIGGSLSTLEKSIDELNDIVNVLQNNTLDIETDVMADSFYTKSKVIEENKNYLQDFTTTKMGNKTTHPAMTIKQDKNGQDIEVLSVEDRLVALEGAVIEIKKQLEVLQK